MTRNRVPYFKILTAVWAVYFYLKASAYFWMASKMSLEQGLFISIVGSKKTFPLMKKWNLLPPAELLNPAPPAA
jgi:hypothetical protein